MTRSALEAILAEAEGEEAPPMPAGAKGSNLVGLLELAADAKAAPLPRAPDVRAAAADATAILGLGEDDGFFDKAVLEASSKKAARKDVRQPGGPARAPARGGKGRVGPGRQQ